MPLFYDRSAPTVFVPSLHVQGAWRTDEQHMAPVAGMIAEAIQTQLPRPDLTLARISFDIFGVIGLAETTVTATVARPGRTIEVVTADAVIAGRTAVRATAWRLAAADTTAVAGGAGTPLPTPDSWPDGGLSQWRGGFIDTLSIRVDPDARPGRVRAWLRTAADLLPDASDLGRFVGLVDTMNGIGARLDPAVWMFPNTDLTIHLFRTPTMAPGGWIGFDITQVTGADGVGLTSAVLYDLDGPVGRAEQILTVRPMPAHPPSAS